ncbi:Proteophosphoglycan [Microbotryum lychnidis-dioicae p1A1 Lamole]|uniref:Proteophosphoglycan n=1 Tax=Microbotryum lychnidis-dioicae (strain p1A1 Lamole / MvSl-1064) TaxID=683840 RepID=U5HHT8_USTV1|nr:Proteophosphoglycan [Microbotryum lychnidis-dioicae p1A1 Lamole]|eukprot:KDE02866.1 Proteophosphoglycan [Microbotryum lychnidis-dioicae p1A1 Lamole]
MSHDRDLMQAAQASASSSTSTSTSVATKSAATSSTSASSLVAASASAGLQLPSTSDTYDFAALRGVLPAGHDSDYSDRKHAQERDREPAVGPSTSVLHSSNYSTPVRAHRETASGERAYARAERISEAVQMKRKSSPALEAYFFSPPTPEELANKIWPKEHEIGTEEALGEVIAGVINTVSRRLDRLTSNSPQYIGVAPDRVETTDKTADVVLLTHAAGAHNPTLPNVWALPRHADPQAKKPDADAHPDTNVNFNANVNGRGQHQNDEDDAKAKVDLNRAKHSFTHVAAVGETKAGNSAAEGQLFRRLSALLVTPIREYAIGFTLRGYRLKLYIMTACGLFFTNFKTVTENPESCRTFCAVVSSTVIVLRAASPPLHNLARRSPRPVHALPRLLPAGGRGVQRGSNDDVQRQD